MQAVAHTETRIGHTAHPFCNARTGGNGGYIAGILLATLIACVVAATPGVAAASEVSDTDTSVFDTTDRDTTDSDTLVVEASSSSETGTYQMRTPIRERSIVLTAPAVDVHTTIGPGYGTSSYGTSYASGAAYTSVTSRSNTTVTTRATTSPNRGRFVPRERR